MKLNACKDYSAASNAHCQHTNTHVPASRQAVSIEARTVLAQHTHMYNLSVAQRTCPLTHGQQVCKRHWSILLLADTPHHSWRCRGCSRHSHAKPLLAGKAT